MIEPLAATEQDVRKAEYAELKQQVVRAREHINRINIHAHTEHLAAIQTAEYNYTVCSAHLTMLGTMAATAFSVFVAAVQEIATELLAGTVISMVVRGTDTLTVELLTNGTCVDLDAASGFEYTMGSLVLRAAMLKIYGGSLMVIDDATDQISATMCSTLLLLLNRVAAILPTVIVITQVAAIQTQLPQLNILRDGFSRVAIGDVVAIADVPADCRNNPVVIGTQPHYIQVAGGYLCTRCTKRTIVKNPHTRHNKLHE
jgi:DNA repair exonuclease SbcCD ATPase subunit